MRKRRNQRAAEENDSPNDFDLIGSLLPAATAISDQEEDAETDEILRETTLILLRLCYAKAQAELGSINQELDLLKSAPPEPSRAPADASDPRFRQRQEQDAMWRIDTPQGSDTHGPLLDPDGKVSNIARDDVPPLTSHLSLFVPSLSFQPEPQIERACKTKYSVLVTTYLL